MSEHILRVTRAADDEHDAEYGMVCQSADPTTCIAWWECLACSTSEEFEELKEQLYGNGETVIHGIAHQMIDGMIAHVGKACVTQCLDREFDFDPEELSVGDHPVDYDCDEGWVYITLAAEVTS